MKLFVIAVLLAAVLAGCATDRHYPLPRRAFDLPPCRVNGQPGVWYCEVTMGRRCWCKSPRWADEWMRRNLPQTEPRY